MNFYIADTHFGHENVIKFDNRPFSCADEMDRVIIEQWNAVVGKNDDVYIVGDFCYRSKNGALWYLKQLNGRKHLIQGNHDKFLLKDEAVMKEFASVDKMTYIKDGSYLIVLCHFPIAEWNHYHRQSWHIYGHIHNQKKGCYNFLEKEERALNAGCMINHYTPVTIEQLIENNRAFKADKSSLKLNDGSFDSIFSRYYKSILIYHFYINGERAYTHTFSEVMSAAYECKGVFEIADEDRHEYSQQELNLLEVLLTKKDENKE